jgi:hypothetical protein
MILFGITVLRLPINQAQTNPDQSGSEEDCSRSAEALGGGEESRHCQAREESCRSG